MKKYTIQLNWNIQYYNEILILHWSTDSLSSQLNSHQVVVCMFLWNVTQIAIETNEGQKRRHTFPGLQFMTTTTKSKQRRRALSSANGAETTEYPHRYKEKENGPLVHSIYKNQFLVNYRPQRERRHL